MDPACGRDLARVRARACLRCDDLSRECHEVRAEGRQSGRMLRMRTAPAWLLVVAWAAVIFALSSVPSLAVTEGLVDLLLRKAAHMTEYALLAILLVRALAS